jgi:uncharacterized protein
MATNTTTANSYRSRTGRVRAILGRCESVAVALSGGVDSAVLLALAVEALGSSRVVAVTGRSASLPDSDLADARSVAEALDVEHVILETREMDRPGYRANAGDRCLHCRTELFELLQEFARGRDIRFVAYGAIADDVGDFRPGMLAAETMGVLAPLLEAGLGKSDVRRLAEQLDLPVSEKPAGACLASRIPVGVEVTAEGLGQVAEAEKALRRMGFQQLRVRHHGEIARIELDDDGLARIAVPELRRAVAEAIRSAGFKFATIDIEGYRAGSLNPGADVRPGTRPGRLHRIGPARDSGQ